ncbi:MBL fold metallo-hydrolase [Candidatus Albibeggiatoa sp. nov. BB20]|uniref:MBL fold metallo-hydrolase n=1 Tax=Candidatus Albibeggiatoa sp. nov. BB20 TaxID=3162723 RepID=UPI00336586FE
MDNFVHIVEDHASKQMAVVDPAWEADEIQAFARDKDCQITDILLTHTHTDHINAMRPLIEQLMPHIHISPAEASYWQQPYGHLQLHQDGDTLMLGETAIQVIHTPGHTPGSSCYWLDNHAITGDTLFVFGCGRCDLRGGNPKQMYHSLHKLVATLPPETEIHPGHYYSVKPTSTMAEEVAGNPFLHCENEDEFVTYRMVTHDQVRSSPYDAVPKN